MLNGHCPERPQPHVFHKPPAAADPVAPVRLSITISSFSSNKNRLRIGLGPDIVHELTNGLAHPKLKVEGDCASGLRIYCTDHGGYSPMVSNGWFVHVPLKKVKGRPVRSALRPVAFAWDRGEHGPVLCIPRLPDDFIPESVLDKMPRCQLDPETRAARKQTALSVAWDAAEQRLKEEMALAFAEAGIEPEPKPEPEPEIEPEIEPEPPEPEPEPVEDPEPETVEEPNASTVAEVRAAVQMLNELLDAHPDEILLVLDLNNRVRAQKRVVTVRYDDI